ncbi:MAG TPA: DUF6225 family protein [Streptosporangiaceae bacterium]|jgi:hypothetical protein|nr:DUF6225 family protein [Streptosporangiaceae bacterium]
MKLVKHEVSAWTVGQLRKALTDLPDDMPIRVAPLEEPGGDLEAPLQVVTSTEIRAFAEDAGSPAFRAAGGDYITLECDFPSGEYAHPAE